MNQLYTVAVAALLLTVSSTAAVAAGPSADESTAFAVEGRPIEAVLCHVNDDGTGEYVMVRSKAALRTHLEEHSRDYHFGTKLGPCELGGGTPQDTESGTDGSETTAQRVTVTADDAVRANVSETTVPA